MTIYASLNSASSLVGVVQPANGGTGVASPTAHTLPVAEGSSPFNFLGPLTNGQLLIGSTGADPSPATITAGTGISVTNGAGTITIAATSVALAYTSVNHAASPYTVLSTDDYISVDTSGGVVTLNFPNAPSSNKVYIVKDRLGTAAASNITLTTPGGVVTFDGSTSYVLSTNFKSVQLIFNGSNYEVY